MGSQFYIGIRLYEEKVINCVRGGPFICETASALEFCE